MVLDLTKTTDPSFRSMAKQPTMDELQNAELLDRPRLDLFARLRTAAQRGGMPQVMATPIGYTAPTGTGVATLPIAWWANPVGSDHTTTGGSAAPYIEWGGLEMTYGPDTNYAANKSVTYNVPGGSTNRSSNPYWFGFCTDAPSFEIGIRGFPSSKYRLLVNEGRGFELANATPVADKASDGSHWYDLWTPASAGPREYRVMADANCWLRRIMLPSALYSIWKPKVSPNRIKALFIGDSYPEGTGRAYPDGNWPFVSCYHLGWDCFTAGVGGTGLLATSSNTRSTYRQRFSADVSAYQPDVIVIQLSGNDIGFGQTALTAELIALLAQAVVENPGALIIVEGSWNSRNTIPSWMDAVGLAGVQATLAASPKVLWVPTITALDGAWDTGTGRVGSTTGDGNSDIYTDTDGTHKVQVGLNYRGWRFAAAVKAAIGA